MPPKKTKADNGQKKAEQKKKALKMADMTFGLKNKNKSKSVQNYVNQVETAAKMAGRSLKELKDAEARKAQRQAVKDEKERLARENAALFKTVVSAVKQEQGPEGADPKSILCGFFKSGACVRGKKCKYSHDMDLIRKTAKLSVYADPRETMDKWDQAKLEDVVKQKDNKANATSIICKYFLDALESKKYGWFWECPNGNQTCQYRHCLPPGYVLKSQEKKQDDDDDDDKPTLEEEIEEERKKLDLTKCTPVTPETFAKWKEDRKKAKIAEDEKKRKEAEKKGGGRGLDVLSGRALFQFDQSLFIDDADAVDADDYEIRAVEEEEETKADGQTENKGEAAAHGASDDNKEDNNDQDQADDAEGDENNEDEQDQEDGEDNEDSKQSNGKKSAESVPEPKKEKAKVEAPKPEKAKAEAPKAKKEEPKPKAAEPKKPAAKAEQPKQPEAKPTSAAIDESLFLDEELPDD